MKNFDPEKSVIIRTGTTLKRDPNRILVGTVKGPDDNGLKAGERVLVELHEEGPLILYQRPDGSRYFDPPGHRDRAIGVLVERLAPEDTVDEETLRRRALPESGNGG